VKNIVKGIQQIDKRRLSPELSPKERKETGSRFPKGSPCTHFIPQKWRGDLCAECWHKKLDHAESLLVEQLSKEDPTEVFQLVRLVGFGK
jgi:hypothetical protein